MTSLINANIAYILLMFGSVFLLLALVTPGTHFIEAATFIFLFMAGYEIYNLGFNWWALIILALSLVPFIYALRKKGLNWALALSILLLIGGSLYIFPGQGFVPAVHPVVAIVISLMSASFIWLVVRKGMQAVRARAYQDPDRLVGQIGEARTEIQQTGSVQLASELWSARSKKIIPAGSRVKVIGREGFTLVVEPRDQSTD